MLKNYYRLTKPGIVYGNVFTTLAAFLFASRWHFGLTLFFATMIGMALVIASACVFNNYLDRGIDSKMERTKNRALVSGAISNTSALIFGAVLVIVGVALLYFYVNALTAALAFFGGFIMYVFAYTFSKRVSHWGTVVGTIPGATPVVAGYTAITGQLDFTALLLFLILVFWQLPHFYAIAIYRLDEYKAAGIPVLPIQKGMRITKYAILACVILFIAATAALTFFGYAGYLYFIVVLVLGLVWLWKGLQGFKAVDDAKWARRLFFFSLIVLVGFSVALSIAPITP